MEDDLMFLVSLQVKTNETHGYTAVQVGYQVVPERKVTKPELNHLKKSGCPPMRKLKEYRVILNLKIHIAALRFCSSRLTSDQTP